MSPVKSPAASLAVFVTVAAACAVFGQVKPAPGCQFMSVPAANFGNYDPADPSDTVTSDTFTVKCGGGIDETISASTGANSSDYNNRLMRGGDGNDTLRYQLYIDSARTIVWGDGTGNTSPIIAVENGAFNDHTIYASMPAGQNGGIGTYSDTITITILP